MVRVCAQTNTFSTERRNSGIYCASFALTMVMTGGSEVSERKTSTS
eukprot:CAMPEP_0185833286 /NCGR_PEP_ID=MMETSP1353-20130828/2586_1 /TAXON_ID=1077150 /ORGANISM="Erythrolobus australicus, Strain CCMP3124" /LENGTH=45 /DNA_ID= /DNA_START= /DNA_END= /DNA_ORIENTATION=